MNFYADSSWWLAVKCRRDMHHKRAWRFFDRNPSGGVMWTPWQRVEVFNCFLQAERHGLVEEGEGRQMIGLLYQEVRLGYWPHRELSWTNAIRRACQISADHSLDLIVRGMDLFHVAIALELKAEGFLSFDEEQKELASRAGLRLMKL
jgi:predicted nucleic acid-binding protein